ncbi:hypothetical protein [Bacillus sp. V59.32b]|uniref:hypothetical protein n=1 Tax=Bacillus sp. V59.32b TaxID=1758642 RepID=UPI0013590ED8|nr:hypothetical protein [Bacillus sp. V59.32b]
MQRVVFRNDLSPAEAIELCIRSEGQVDIVTDVAPSASSRVISSSYTKLIAVDANQVLAGTFNLL